MKLNCWTNNKKHLDLFSYSVQGSVSHKKLIFRMLTAKSVFFPSAQIVADCDRNELNSNRKRNRTQEEEQVLEETMQIDEDHGRAICDLNEDELNIAQQIAQEKIKATLFIHVEIPSNTFKDEKVAPASQVEFENSLNVSRFPIKDRVSCVTFKNAAILYTYILIIYDLANLLLWWENSI